jgi:hypothetical protein
MYSVVSEKVEGYRVTILEHPEDWDAEQIVEAAKHLHPLTDELRVVATQVDAGKADYARTLEWVGRGLKAGRIKEGR